MDDFLGCITLDVAEIASSAKPIDNWYTLQGRSDKSQVRGELHLRVWLGTREDRAGHDDGDNMIDVRQHIHICRQFAQYEIEQTCKVRSHANVVGLILWLLLLERCGQVDGSSVAHGRSYIAPARHARRLD